jgi:hypothetical protein
LGIGRFRRVAECDHEETITFGSDGVETEVCQVCGHVTLRFEAMISADIDRLLARRVGRTKIR